MSVSSSLTYALLCVYYACRAVLLFAVELLLFLPSYYLVERHDVSSAWLGRRGEAQVQPVLSAAYQYQKAEERDKLNYSDSVNIVPVGTGAPPLDSSTREMENNRCILLRKSVSRIRSLHIPTVSPSSSWSPQASRSVNPSSPTHSPGTPQLRQQRQHQPLLPSFYSHPRAALLQSKDSIGGDDDMNGSVGSWSNYTMGATPVTTTLHRPFSLSIAEVSGWRDGTSGGELIPISLQSSPMQRCQRPQLQRGSHQRPSGGGVDEEDAACTSFNGCLSAAARDAVDIGYQQPCVTDTFFDGVAVSVLVSAQEQQQQDRLAVVRKRVGITEAEGLFARLGHRQCEAASRRAAARTSSIPAYAAAARERMRATVPMWCTVIFHSPTPQSAARGSVKKNASSPFRGQYGFLPPWYAVHARAQLLLALVDPLLRIAAELLWCRGWGTLTASCAAQREEFYMPGSITTASATAASPEHQRLRQHHTHAPPSPSWPVCGSWQDAGVFLLGPLLLCFRVLRGLFYAIMGPPGATAPLHYSACTSSSPTSPNTAGGGGLWHPFRRFEGAAQARIDHYTMDTRHIFEPLHNNAAATTTVSSAAATVHTGGSIAPAPHTFSRSTTTSAKAAGTARSQAHAASLPHPASPASAPAPVCRKSVGVYWLHGRRPPIWSAAPADDPSIPSAPQPPSPAPVVVLLLCPSLLQGSGLYQHTVTRLSCVCQLLTLTGAWQASVATDEVAADRIFLPSPRGMAMTRNATQNRDDSTDTDSAVQTPAPVAEEAYKPVLLGTSSSKDGNIRSSGAEVIDQPSPPTTSLSLPSAKEPTTRPSTQWYAAVPVVELRVPATSPERTDDVSMPPLTLGDLRHIVERLRSNLESCTPPAPNPSVSCPSTATGRSARPDSFGHAPSPDAAAEVSADPRPRRAVYIVAVGWSEAASPLLELAITQQQQTSTGSGRSTEEDNGGGSGEQSPARLDGLVCISHTLSSAFQLLPQQRAEGLVLQRSTRAASSPARATRGVAHAGTSAASSGGALSTIAAPAGSSPLVTARLQAASRMPRILSSLTTGPARLLVLLTRMQLIADALLAHRQQQEQWQGGGSAVGGSASIPQTAGGLHYVDMHAPMQPEHMVHKRAGAPPSQAGPAQMPDISFYRILRVFREAREEVNRAQRGLDRATITWTHQRQQQQTRSAQRGSVFDSISSMSAGNLSALTSRATEDDAEMRITRAAAAAAAAAQQHSLSPSPASARAASVLDSTTNALRQYGLRTASLSKFVHVISPPDSAASMPPTAPSRNAAAVSDAVGEANVLAAPTITPPGRSGCVLSSLTVDQGTPLSHDRMQTPSFSHPWNHGSPLIMRQDLLQESSALWGMPHLEGLMDWDEVAKSSMMADAQQQQQQRLEAASATANVLPSLLSSDPPILRDCGGRRHFLTASWAEGEGERFSASDSVAATSSSFVGNPLRRACSHMSTEDVVASCTLQMLSPTVRQVARLPGSGALGAPQTAAATRGVASASNRDKRSDLVDHAKEASTADGEGVLLVGAARMRPSSLHPDVTSRRDSGDRARAAPSFTSEQLASGEFSLDATSALSALIATSADGGASNLCVVGAEGKACRAASPSVSPSWKDATLYTSEKPVKSSVSHYDPQHSLPQPLLSVSTLLPQPQQPIPYPPPSRLPALSSQAAALVELRVRSAQHAALIQRIRVPTLLVHASDDPVAPTSTLPFSLLQANPWITTVLTRRGSHAVFMEGASEVWRRPRLVVTERARPTETTLPASGAAVAEGMVYRPGSGLDDVGSARGARDGPHWKTPPSPSSPRGDKVVSSPTADTSQRSPALIAAGRSKGLYPFAEKANAKLVCGNGTGSSSTTISNSCSTDDFDNDGDTISSAIVEWLPVVDADADVKRHTDKRQSTAFLGHPQQEQQLLAAATPSTWWQVRIDGTTWLERLLFEYVEKVIVCPPAASSPIG
ncbi:conserved hypothetical protein [Leishmania mexicana MHOM/GT/2001/U1103]|uniref:Uncharacterized protein n=1 Tax=Leishmania mexicana (strain MHOM/GT/2001/U1103) TaxID=929439 RepID=E9AN42_LEIMU|nr:conserved hypothetical protein [Leishmania mexicana MHOM/GT/2001/U1103]CBZ24347.1 conserved hypothetical protein [Leishmania mexicana MHOM/GT/2001/U1103]